MAFLVLFSTVSFTVKKHYCGNELIDVSVFSEVKRCGMEVVETSEKTVTKKSCCKDTVDVIKGQDELNVKTFNDLDFQQQLFISSFSYSFLNLFLGDSQEFIPHKNYSPPNLISDIHVLDQVFII